MQFPPRHGLPHELPAAPHAHRGQRHHLRAARRHRHGGGGRAEVGDAIEQGRATYLLGIIPQRCGDQSLLGLPLDQDT